MATMASMISPPRKSDEKKWSLYRDHRGNPVFKAYYNYGMMQIIIKTSITATVPVSSSVASISDISPEKVM